MPENIYEDSVIKIEATLREGGILSKSYSGKLDLTYMKNDATQLLKEQNIDVPKGSIKRTYTVPKVADTEETYNLKVIADYGKTKEKHRVLVDATVWPKTVEVTVKDLKTSNPVPDVEYKVEQLKKGVKGNSNNVGVGTQNLKKAPYSVAIQAPWELVSNKNDAHKRKHQIVVTKNPVAKFLAPDIDADCYVPATAGGDKSAGVRQYVNVATAQDGCDALGSIIEFEVCHKEQSKGRSGDRIYIKVTYGKLSKRNSPLPALLAPCQGIASANNGKTLTGYTTIGADEGSAKFQLQLGYAGGETFVVSCGYSQADPSDDKITLQTWRKLTYQIRYPNMMQARLTQRARQGGANYHDIPDSIKNLVIQRLGAVFVEYENRKSLSYADPAVGSPSRITKGFMDLSADVTEQYVMDGSQNWIGAATAFDAPTPREITVTLCDRAYSSRTKTLAPTLSCTAPTTETNIDTAASYLYFVKTPAAANQANLVVANYEWEADLANVAAGDQNKKPSFACSTVEGDAGGPLLFRVGEPTSGGPAVTIECDDWDDVPDSEKTRLKTYYEACFTNAATIRQAGFALSFQITGASKDAGSSRLANIKAVLQQIHNDSAMVIPHPGLDGNGAPRRGPTSDIAITHVNGRRKKIVLPTGGANKPGDFVGAPSATKCPVKVSFSIEGTYAINGNAGAGAQILVLKDTLPGPCASTVCHELGHSMGMSAMSPSPTPSGLTAPLHVDNGGWYYRDKSAPPYTNGFRNLHAGPHCANGMPAVKKPDAKFSNWSPGATDEVCIMWGSGGSDDNRKNYCATCTDILKARELTDVRTTWNNRAAG